MELIDKVERLQNTIYSSEQANMIDKLKEKGLVSKPIFDLPYGPDRFKNRPDVKELFPSKRLKLSVGIAASSKSEA